MKSRDLWASIHSGAVQIYIYRVHKCPLNRTGDSGTVKDMSILKTGDVSHFVTDMTRVGKGLATLPMLLYGY